MNKNRKKRMEMESAEEARLKGFLDMIAPSVIQFDTDHYICGNIYRSVWALSIVPMIQSFAQLNKNYGMEMRDGTLREKIALHADF